MVTVEIVLHHLHRLELLKTRLLGDFILALVGIMLKMADIGNVAHIAHLVAKMGKIAVKYVECDGRTRMAEMSVAIHRRATHIHAHSTLMYRLEELLCTVQAIVDEQILLYHRKNRLGFERVGDVVVAVGRSTAIYGTTLLDNTKCILEALDIVAKGKEKILGILRSHDDT